MNPLHTPNTPVQIDQRFLFVVDTTICDECQSSCVPALVAWMTGCTDGDPDCSDIAYSAIEGASGGLDWMNSTLAWRIVEGDVACYHRTWSTSAGVSVVLRFNRFVSTEEQAQLRDRVRFFVQHFVQDDTGAHADIFGCDPSMLLPVPIALQGFRLLVEELVHTCAMVYGAED